VVDAAFAAVVAKFEADKEKLTGSSREMYVPAHLNDGGRVCQSKTAAWWNRYGNDPETRCCPTQHWFDLGVRSVRISLSDAMYI